MQTFSNQSSLFERTFEQFRSEIIENWKNFVTKIGEDWNELIKDMNSFLEDAGIEAEFLVVEVGSWVGDIIMKTVKIGAIPLVPIEAAVGLVAIVVTTPYSLIQSSFSASNRKKSDEEFFGNNNWEKFTEIVDIIKKLFS